MNSEQNKDPTSQTPIKNICCFKLF